MTTRTKIICTIGPAVNSLEKMIDLIKAGMSVARLNFSHGTHDEHLDVINKLKIARKQLGVPLAIMIDTKGPEIRLGKIKQREIFLPAGHKWLLVKESLEGDLTKATVTPGSILDKLAPGMVVLFDNGYIGSKVVEKTQDGVIVEITNGGIISSNKGINIPNQDLHLPPITAKDIADIQFGCKNDVDILAISFVRSAEHLTVVKDLLEAEGKQDILIVAKIENNEGVQNFESIVQIADGIMIARGDLGVEVPSAHVPKLQKMMIRKSCQAGKPVVTATQMLESMITNPRPTRAETSDVANAIYDYTTAVMLSGETAVGKFAIETVQMMQSIVQIAEEDCDYRSFFEQHSHLGSLNIPSAVTLAAVKTAFSLDAKAIFALTTKGSTARLCSRLRPKMAIIAVTPDEKIFHQLAFYWGVIPVLDKNVETLQQAFQTSRSFALKQRLISYDDLVVVTAGTPFGSVGSTNMMIVENIERDAEGL